MIHDLVRFAPTNNSNNSMKMNNKQQQQQQQQQQHLQLPATFLSPLPKQHSGSPTKDNTQFSNLISPNSLAPTRN